MKADDLLLSRALTYRRSGPLATTENVSRWWPVYWCLLIPLAGTVVWLVLLR